MTDVRLVCPRCRGPLADRADVVSCVPCDRGWPVHDGVPSFVDFDAVRGVEWLMHTIYDWLAPLHDVAVDAILPLTQGATVAATRDRYMRRLELDTLPDEVGQRAARVLEIGIGTGANLPFLDRHLPRRLAVEPWGLDFSRGMLALCRGRLAEHADVAPRLVHGDAHALPFPDASFDRVFHVGGIASYRDPAVALAEMARVARPGTPIVVVDEQLDPAADHGWLRRLAFRAITFYDGDPHAPRECVPADAVDVTVEQVSACYYCLVFRAPVTPDPARRTRCPSSAPAPGPSRTAG
jgi:ubiquinone/menaquinone biosynthesis C-methylase UbiE